MLMQVALLKHNLEPAPKLFSQPITSEARLYLRLGYSGLDGLDYRVPVGRFDHRSKMLTVHPELEDRRLVFDSRKMSLGTLLKRSKLADRPQREAVFEWARTHPEQVENFFGHLKKKESMGKTYRKYYEGMRMMVSCLSGEDPPLVQKCEEVIKRQLEKTVQFQESKIEKMEALVEKQKKLCEDLKEEIGKGLSIDRQRARMKVRKLFQGKDPEDSYFPAKKADHEDKQRETKREERVRKMTDVRESDKWPKVEHNRVSSRSRSMLRPDQRVEDVDWFERRKGAEGRQRTGSSKDQEVKKQEMQEAEQSQECAGR